LFAWATIALFAVYAGVLFAGGVVQGIPREPYLAIGEVLTMLGAALLVVLFATIHACADERVRLFSVVALGWVVAMACLTISVHFVQLAVGRRIDLATNPGLAHVFGWVWPSLLYGVELVAWHICFGFALVSVAFAFGGVRRSETARWLLWVSGLLCLSGAVGPLVGELDWRMIGVFGYCMVFPVACVFVALDFKAREDASARQLG
jgi:hypothetical protein